MATDLFRHVGHAAAVLDLTGKILDSMCWIEEKNSWDGITEQDQAEVIKLFTIALELQELMDYLKVELDQYVLLADHDYARLGLTDAKSYQFAIFLSI